MPQDGKHILIDFYACYEEPLTDENTLIDAFVTALEEIQFPTQEVALATHDGESVISAFDNNRHIILHIYPELGYVALDAFSFPEEVPTAPLLRILKKTFGAQKVKLTSVNRGDAGVNKDMKPRSKTKLTAKGRVNQTGEQLKKTGTSLKNTGLKVLRVITRKKKASKKDAQ